VVGRARDWLIHYDGLGRLIRVQRPREGTPGDLDEEIRTARFYYDGVRRIQEVHTNPIEVPVTGGGGIGSTTRGTASSRSTRPPGMAASP